MFESFIFLNSTKNKDYDGVRRSCDDEKILYLFSCMVLSLHVYEEREALRCLNLLSASVPQRTRIMMDRDGAVMMRMLRSVKRPVCLSLVCSSLPLKRKRDPPLLFEPFIFFSFTKNMDDDRERWSNDAEDDKIKTNNERWVLTCQGRGQQERSFGCARSS